MSYSRCANQQWPAIWTAVHELCWLGDFRYVSVPALSEQLEDQTRSMEITLCPELQHVREQQLNNHCFSLLAANIKPQKSLPRSQAASYTVRARPHSAQASRRLGPAWSPLISLI